VYFCFAVLGTHPIGGTMVLMGALTTMLSCSDAHPLLAPQWELLTQLRQECTIELHLPVAVDFSTPESGGTLGTE